MKKITRFFLIITLLWTVPIYSDPNRILTVCSDSSAPCFKKCPFLGVYGELNLGHSWFNFVLHRPDFFGLFPLVETTESQKTESFIPALGFDFYPCLKMPFRLELSYFYAEVKFDHNPIFRTPPNNPFSAEDRFLVRDWMGTLYFDWHTCTRWVPFMGLSVGSNNIKTSHHLERLTLPLGFTYQAKENNMSWGGTLGTRYFFTNYLFANLQLRYSNLGRAVFRNLSSFEVLPDNVDYQSDYLHETTVMLGIGYIF